MNKKTDITLVGFAVNPEAAGKDNKYYNFLDSIGAKFYIINFLTHIQQSQWLCYTLQLN